MNRVNIRILLLGADAGRAQTVRAALDGSASKFGLVHERDLESGLSALEAERVDLIMLDLDLASDDWLYALVRIHEAVADLPVIVLADEGTEDLARKAVEIGAHDYLRKDDLRPDLLLRSVRYALDRSRLLKALGRGPSPAVRSGHGGAPAATVTAEMYGTRPLRLDLPDAFARLVTEYGAVLDEALEQQMYRGAPPVGERLRAMASRLGFLKAGPRDVIEIHYAALKAKSAGLPPRKLHAYIDEGRVRLLELMGNLVSYYRTQSLGTWPQREGGSGEPD